MRRKKLCRRFSVVRKSQLYRHLVKGFVGWRSAALAPPLARYARHQPPEAHPPAHQVCELPLADRGSSVEHVVGRQVDQDVASGTNAAEDERKLVRSGAGECRRGQ